jgi:pyrroline-5-carboxylate reductase
MAALQPRIWVLGAGRMGGAIIDGWIKSGLVDLPHLTILDPHPGPEALAAHAAGAVLNPNLEGATPPDVLLLSVKPQIWRATLTALVPHLGAETLTVSIAAGIRFAALAEVLGTRPLVRAMPNTPSAIGAGVTGYLMGQGTDSAMERRVKRLLSPLGLVEKLSDEGLMDALTAVSGSGPAYVFLMVEALAAAGVSAGLPPAQAMRLARQTIIGAGEMLARSKLNASDLRAQVTSPGGTTQAALDVMTEGGALAGLMRRAIDANMRRSKELGRD